MPGKTNSERFYSFSLLCCMEDYIVFVSNFDIDNDK
jgi:hypothetical protein